MTDAAAALIRRRRETAYAIRPEDCDDVLEAIEAEGAVTRRDLELLCHRSGSQIRRRLGVLREAGLVERRRDEEDARKWVYTLRESSP